MEEKQCEFIIVDNNFIQCDTCGAIIFCSEDMQAPKRCPYCYSVFTIASPSGVINNTNHFKARSLVEFIARYNLWDYDVKVQYRDDGGDYNGNESVLFIDVDEKNKEIIL